MFGIAITAVFALLHLFQPMFLRFLDLRIYDTYLRQTLQDVPYRDVVVVDIDEKSLERQGQWPWPRYRIAHLLREIQKYGASVIALDMLFAEEDHTSLRVIQRDIQQEFGHPLSLENVPVHLLENDTVLARTLQEGPFILGYKFLFDGNTGRDGHCVLHPLSVIIKQEPESKSDASLFHQAKGVTCNLPQLSNAVRTSGFFNAVIDTDGILRRVPLIIEYDDGYYPSLALATLMKAGNISHVSVQVESGRLRAIVVGSTSIPVDADGNFLIRYRQKPINISAGDLFSGHVPRELIEGKIVFVGTSATGVGERRATPIDPFLAGVNINAVIAENILQRHFIQRPLWASGVELLCIIVAGLLSTLLLIRTGAVGSLFVLFTGALILWLGSGLLFKNKEIFVSPLIPLITIGFNVTSLTSIKFWSGEHALRVSEEKYRNILESIDDGYFEASNHGEITFINRAASDILGIHMGEAIGLNYLQFMSRNEAARIFRIFNEVYKTGTSAEVMDVEIIRPDGKKRIMEVGTSLIKDSRGIPIGFRGVARDITGRIKLEDTLRQSLHEKEILLKEIHHRVKNNLQIVASLMSLQSDLVNDQKIISVLADSSARVRSIALIHEKLYRSSDLSHVDVRDYIDDLVNYLIQMYRVDADSVTYTLDIEPLEFTMETALPCGLIVNELVSNILKHAFPGKRKGMFSIALHRQDMPGMYRLMVSDDGIGLPVTVDCETTPSLGLRVVGMLTDQLEGTLEISRDRGTTFMITFSELEYKKRI